MTYEWKCHNCQARVEIIRPISMYRDPPNGCSNCGSQDRSAFTKLVSMPQRLARDSGREQHLWPMRNPHLKNPDGTIPVFNSEKEYREGLKARGMTLFCDGDDPLVGPSQKSVFDHYDPAPSKEASEMVERAQYLAADEFNQEDLIDPAAVGPSNFDEATS